MGWEVGELCFNDWLSQQPGLTYEFPKCILWMHGGSTRENFLRHAVYYGPDERVHDDYQVRSRHAIYNAEMKYLTPPAEWLRSIAGKRP
jgi:hypothetical protein